MRIPVNLKFLNRPDRTSALDSNRDSSLFPPPEILREETEAIKRLGTQGARDEHINFSTRHLGCRYCRNPTREFDRESELKAHYRSSHFAWYCHFCDKHFSTPTERDIHTRKNLHPQCDRCSRLFKTQGLLNAHCQMHHPNANKFQSPARKPTVKRAPDHYATLGINAASSHEEVLKAAREMRVRTHPDRLKRQEGLTEEGKRRIDGMAAKVGEAADVLCDPEMRRRYDAKSA